VSPAALAGEETGAEHGNSTKNISRSGRHMHLQFTQWARTGSVACRRRAGAGGHVELVNLVRMIDADMVRRAKRRRYGAPPGVAME
jgi:hypothetical protein